MLVDKRCNVCLLPVESERCPDHPEASIHVLEKPSSLLEDLRYQIDQELSRLGLSGPGGDGSLEVYPTETLRLVALQVHGRADDVLVFPAAEVLQVLRQCPDTSTLGEIWQALLPFHADE